MRTAKVCPKCATYTNSLCAIYNGVALTNIGIEPGMSLQECLVKINDALAQFTTTTTTTTLIPT